MKKILVLLISLLATIFAFRINSNSNENVFYKVLDEVTEYKHYSKQNKIESSVKQNFDYKVIKSIKYTLGLASRDSQNTILGKNIFSKNSNYYYDKSLFTKIQLFDKLMVIVQFLSNNSINFIIKDTKNILKELPISEPFPYHNIKEIESNDKGFSSLNVLAKINYDVIVEKDKFRIKIIRKSTKEIIFDSKDYKLLLSNNFISLKADIPNTKLIFGLGERTAGFKLKSGKYTLYNKDAFGNVEDGKGGNNRYGSHPMYLMREKSGFYHISFLRNSYPMDIILNLDKNDVEVGKISTIEYITIGGVLDFTFFLGKESETIDSFTGKLIPTKNPISVINDYHKFIGGFTLPPFWSMGFQQSRWGYDTKEKIVNVLDKYKQNKLPLDVFWMDIDYMIQKKPFTFDESRYGTVEEFNKIIRKNKVKFVMIVEPEIGLNKIDSDEFRSAISKNLFIKNQDGGILLNRVWPGTCAFYDYFNPKIFDFWSSQLESFYNNKIQFNGIWLDMNEIAAFSEGQVDAYGNSIQCNDVKFPYLPGGANINSSTICSNAIHYNNLPHIILHNYYGSQQALVTKTFLEKKFANEFPFILTRSNSPGIGKYASHWSGDNKGFQVFLEKSITEIFNSGLFGIPHVGADICGFGENTSDDMCAKWYQVGSLYPFSRAHNHLDFNDKEPFNRSKEVLATFSKSIKFRYSILKHYYSEFIKLNGKGMLFKPLFIEFDGIINDSELMDDNVVDQQFMIGSQLMVVPNFTVENPGEFLDEKHRKIANLSKAFFPGLYEKKILWFDLRDDSEVEMEDKNSKFILVKVGLNEIPAVFLRSKHLFLQNIIEDKFIENSFDLNSEYILVSALQDGYSKGSFALISDYNNKEFVQACQESNCLIYFEIIENTEKNYIELAIMPPKHLDEKFSCLLLQQLKIFNISEKILLYIMKRPNINVNLTGVKIKNLSNNNNNIALIFKNKSIIIHNLNLSICKENLNRDNAKISFLIEIN